MGDWKNLPCDVLLIISDHFNIYSDYVRFRAVCASWRSNFPWSWPTKKHLCYNIPWLMLPDENHDQKVRCLYNPLNVDEVCYLELPEIRYPNYGNLRGSSNGWLVILEDGLTLKLLNPLTKSQIQLPSVSTFPDIKEYDPSEKMFTIIDRMHYHLSQHYVHATYVKKIVLSSSTPSNSNDSMAIAIYGPYSKLAFTKFVDNDDDKWIDIPTSLDFFHDCTFFDGKIYAIDHFGRLEVAPIDNPTKMVKFVHLRQPKLKVGSFNLSLVKRDDDLILVERIHKVERNKGAKRTFDFNLYKLDSDGWLEINDLEGYTIFLGRFNTSICISNEYCSELKGNQIYFTFDRNKPFFGVFDFKDRSWQCLLHSDPSNSNVWPHPSLVVLNPY